MREKYKALLEERIQYIARFRGKKFYDEFVMDKAVEFRKEHNHGKYKPDDFMRKQVNYIYWKIARLYREVKKDHGSGQRT